MNVSQESMFRLANLANAGPNPVFMTGQEGQELVANGYIAPIASEPGPVPGSCRVQITEAGLAALTGQPGNGAAPAPQAVTTQNKPVINEVRVGVPVPKAAKRGGANNLRPRKSAYPFDQLTDPVIDPTSGQPQCASFHVACSPSNPEPWKAMASNVAAANARSAEVVKDANGQPVMETVEKKTLIKGADKKPMLDSNGKRQYNVAMVTQEKTQPTKKFIARRVGDDDPDGPGVRVFRVPLDY